MSDKKPTLPLPRIVKPGEKPEHFATPEFPGDRGGIYSPSSEYQAIKAEDVSDVSLMPRQLRMQKLELDELQRLLRRDVIPVVARIEMELKQHREYATGVQLRIDGRIDHLDIELDAIKTDLGDIKSLLQLLTSKLP